MDSDRLGRLIDQHAAALELDARQWSDAAEDVVQLAFLKLAQQERPPDNPAAWLFRAVRNGAINAAMAARRRRRHESEAASARRWFRDPTELDHPDALDPAVAEAELQRAAPGAAGSDRGPPVGRADVRADRAGLGDLVQHGPSAVCRRAVHLERTTGGLMSRGPARTGARARRKSRPHCGHWHPVPAGSIGTG